MQQETEPRIQMGVRSRFEVIADDAQIEYFHRTAEADRNRQMYNEFVRGATTTELGEKYGLSRARVHFIVRRVAARTGQKLNDREKEVTGN